ncbi:hypothetical protein CONLIGDRAFT_205862 [Coniochaeta ligniaria NRRL 30616]|uniref:Uncharacterized protein n=1 Tax=Coniochaeta ligniaria NRRL 30616 TaxID=1408157 RepID=A0A1J7J1T8_9PEZI|nr:hypothetical protein CONLIGDRAFT_205862 [Coniochaeta ligniaria NRRL 30616]
MDDFPDERRRRDLLRRKVRNAIGNGLVGVALGEEVHTSLVSRQLSTTARYPRYLTLPSSAAPLLLIPQLFQRSLSHLQLPSESESDYYQPSLRALARLAVHEVDPILPTILPKVRILFVHYRPGSLCRASGASIACNLQAPVPLASKCSATPGFIISVARCLNWDRTILLCFLVHSAVPRITERQNTLPLKSNRLSTALASP